MPAERQPTDNERRFAILAMQYQLDYIFNVYDLALQESPACKALIQSGWDFLPLIIKDLKNNATPWLPILSTITGENPIPENHKGDALLTVGDWQAWYEKYKKSQEPSPAPTLTLVLGTA